MSDGSQNACWVCGEPSTTRCSACPQSGDGIDVVFCSTRCQVMIHPIHRLVCGKGAHPFTFPPLSPSELEDSKEHLNTLFQRLSQPGVGDEAMPALIDSLGNSNFSGTATGQVMLTKVRGCNHFRKITEAPPSMEPNTSAQRDFKGEAVTDGLVLTSRLWHSCLRHFSDPLSPSSKERSELLHRLLTFNFFFVKRSPGEEIDPTVARSIRLNRAWVVGTLEPLREEHGALVRDVLLQLQLYGDLPDVGRA